MTQTASACLSELAQSKDHIPTKSGSNDQVKYGVFDPKKRGSAGNRTGGIWLGQRIDYTGHFAEGWQVASG